MRRATETADTTEQGCAQHLETGKNVKFGANWALKEEPRFLPEKF